MAVPGSIPTQTSGGTASAASWANLVKTSTDWSITNAPLFVGQMPSSLGYTNADSTEAIYGTTGSTGEVFGVTPLINIGGFVPSSGFSSGGTEPESLLVPEPGVYRIVAHVPWTSNSTGMRLARIKWRGAGLGGSYTTMAENKVEAVSTGETEQEVSWVMDLADEDQLAVGIYQESGGTLGPSTSPYLTVEWLRRSPS